MDQNNTRNTVVFVVCAAALMLLYQVFVMGPIAKKREAEAQQHAAAVAAAPIAMAEPGSSIFVTREQATAQSPRVQINTPALQGSLALKGGRLDDLYLKQYRETLAKNAPPVELFRPEGAKNAYFSDSGWTGPIQAPGPATLWTAEPGATLTPSTPVTLTWDNGQGLIFTRTISVDQKYMFTVVNTVTNRGAAAVKLAPYASVQRQGIPTLTPNWLVNEGAIGSLNGVLKQIAFKNWKKNGDQAADTTGGYMGITDKYWLAAVSPDQREPVHGEFKVSNVNGADVYEADYVGQPRTLATGQQTSETTHVFGGAKKVSILQDYEKTLGIPHFRRRGGLGLALVLDPADVFRAGDLLPPVRQLRPGDPRPHRGGEGADVPAGEQVLRIHVEDEEAAAADRGDQEALPRRSGQAAARDHGLLQDRTV